jgi:hypothetical protein
VRAVTEMADKETKQAPAAVRRAQIGLTQHSSSLTLTQAETKGEDTLPEDLLEGEERVRRSGAHAVKEVVVHPLVLLSVVDHYNRVARDTQKRVVSTLRAPLRLGLERSLRRWACCWARRARGA